MNLILWRDSFVFLVFDFRLLRILLSLNLLLSSSLRDERELSESKNKLVRGSSTLEFGESIVETNFVKLEPNISASSKWTIWAEGVASDTSLFASGIVRRIRSRILSGSVKIAIR